MKITKSEHNVTIPIDVERRTLRIPKKLYQKLQDAALVDKRSINAEVLWILELHLNEQLIYRPHIFPYDGVLNIPLYQVDTSKGPTASELTERMLEL